MTELRSGSANVPMLEVRDLVVEFRLGRGRTVRAVDGVSVRVGEGETVGVVGESGSGKSTLARSVVGLTKPQGGAIRFNGRDITHVGRRERRGLAREIQYVFQDPYSSLNPTRTIEDILSEPLFAQGISRGTDRRKRVGDLLDLVGLPASCAARYPGSFSGGQRQRIAIARALIMSPKLLICDEPTSALDLSIQAQILNLLRDLQRQFKISYLFIAHNLDVVRIMADRTVVMSNGHVMEEGPADQIARFPTHAYTQALIAATPHADPEQQRLAREQRLARKAATGIPHSDTTATSALAG
jgi:ABC-type oligopeptide transport system ATPase subunit